MLLPVLSSMLLGAIIGYVTNWVAIKMLFHPLDEKRILGRRIPFTPGLIPKQRSKLAESLADAVVDYLVTADTLRASLEQPEFRRSLTELSQMLLRQWSEEAYTLQEILEELRLLPLVQRSVERLVDSAIVSLQEPHLREAALRWVADVARQVAAGRSAELLSAEDIAEQLRLWFRGILTRQGLKSSLSTQLQQCAHSLIKSGKTLGDQLTLAQQERLRALILQRGPDWLDQAGIFLQSSAAVSFLSATLEEVIDSSPLLRLFGKFIDHEKLIISLVEKLNEEEVRIWIAEAALRQFDALLTRRMDEVEKLVSLDTIDRAIEWLLEQVLNPTLADRLLDRLISAWGEFEGTWSDLITSILGEQSQATRDLLWNRADDWLASTAAAQALQSLCIQLWRAVLQVRPIDLPGASGRFQSDAATEVMISSIQTFFAVHGASLLESLNLRTTISQQIDRLDIIEVEQILLDVMRDQLRAITNLGLLLGGLIGVLTPFINQWVSGIGS